MYLTWIGDDDTSHVRGDHLHDRSGIACGFHYNVVVVREPPGECLEMITSHTYPAQPDDLPFVEHHRLG
jgi:hypothetical protein